MQAQVYNKSLLDVALITNDDSFMLGNGNHDRIRVLCLVVILTRSLLFKILQCNATDPRNLVGNNSRFPGIAVREGTAHSIKLLHHAHQL